MARQKKPKYEYVEQLGLYRKRVQDATGKYVAVYGQTQDELSEKLSNFDNKSNLSPIGRKNPLVNDYIQEWVELHTVNMTYGGQVDYQSIINRNIKPYLKGKHLLDVRPDHLREIMLGVTEKSESVYRKTYQLLNQIFTSAYENQDIPYNPCPKPSKGGVPTKERIALTDQQVNVLLDAVKDTRAYVFCMIAIYSGMRREEILGLKWDCVFLDDTPRIEVKRALRFEHNRPVVSEKLKTKAAKRIIPIPDQLVICLREALEKSNSSHVIADKAGNPLSGSSFRELWMAVKRRSVGERTVKKVENGQRKTYTIMAEKGQKAAHRDFFYTIDFQVTPHILRHTYITNLLLAGIDIKTVQYLAGHENSKITLDIYAHLTYNRPEDILKKVQAAFDGNQDREDFSYGKDQE